MVKGPLRPALPPWHQRIMKKPTRRRTPKIPAWVPLGVPAAAAAADALSATGTVREYLPDAAAVAIILFVVGVLIGEFYKRAERSRKTSAIKLLLAEELERNHWALVAMFGILEMFDKYPRAAPWLHTGRNGAEYFRMKVEPENEFSQAIPRFCTAMYERLLPTLAELDKALFEIVRTTYERIAVLNRVRDTLTGFLAGEDLASDPANTKHFLGGFAKEKDAYYAVLNKGYKALTGKELKAWRVV
jgi:hypothetical protein